ncbi:MAG: hypothetical protein UW41_C0016G0029 [Candidatus Collierbacteria bacterium GW2011_GWC2_44_18]|uniref:PIN domain-containing protein n=2 Tax=Microgenomates group TaxID=1794810 RepID=A0A0G1J6G3_9BACT|nr:MAG: hypothetical protein UW16_C0027G0007 [Microgenomates group bacterium GW2011_GWC1_44_10]KKT48892.1 MAG: hypothetical protein UW41_C0016G0029 [Candidatus Collierbacteria bacterium GW2011_GWC2_44_18]KKT67216.1 MAG: hypothetical protein UW60_C0011G0016 [Candidatus Woesebacteria bacterium GW2011_GWA2_44_33]
MKRLIDSDFLVGLFRDADAHHEETLSLLENETDKESDLYVVNLVLFETATVLAHRVNMDAVRLFYDKLPKLNLKIISFDEKLESMSWEMFLKQTKKGCSFVDCANMAVLRRYRLDGILSFDKFYPDKIRSIP